MSSEPQTRQEVIDEIEKKYTSTDEMFQISNPDYPQWPDMLDGEIRKDLHNFATSPLVLANQQTENENSLVLEEDTSGVTVQFIGCAGLIFDDGTDFILVDPYFSRPDWSGINGAMLSGGEKIAPDKALVTKYLEHSMQAYPRMQENPDSQYPEVLFCTHGHFDHALDIGCTSQVIKEKLGRYPKLYAGRSVLNVILPYLISETQSTAFLELETHLRSIRYDEDTANKLYRALRRHWRDNFKGQEKHSYNEDEDKMRLWRGRGLLGYDDGLHFDYLCDVLLNPDTHTNSADMETQMQNLAVLFKIDKQFDEEGDFLIDGKHITQLLEPVRDTLDSLYDTFNFHPIDGYNCHNVESGDRPFDELSIETLAQVGAFKLKALKGFHINIPNFSCRGTNPIPIPLPFYTSDMNTGVLFNAIIEHDKIDGKRILCQGSANFHKGQTETVFNNARNLLNGSIKMPNMILGAPGISLGLGQMVGPPGPDHDRFKDFYKEIIIDSGTTKALFHHWDDFKANLQAPMKWFNNILADDTHDIIDKAIGQMKHGIYEDELYQKVVKEWDDLTENDQTLDRNKHLNPNFARTFEFLPLFKRIKL